MERVRSWCGQPSDRGRLKNRNRNIFVLHVTVLLPVGVIKDDDTAVYCLGYRYNFILRYAKRRTRTL